MKLEWNQSNQGPESVFRQLGMFKNHNSKITKMGPPHYSGHSAGLKARVARL